MNRITPCIWFDNNAETAARFYCDLFPNSRMIDPLTPTAAGEKPPVVVIWEVFGQRMMGINGGPTFTLDEAFSLRVDVDGQGEVDQYWNALIADGGAESQCGWLKDRFGLSWQIVPQQLMELMGDPDPEKSKRVTQAMLKMKKIIVADLEAAHAG